MLYLRLVRKVCLQVCVPVCVHKRLTTEPVDGSLGSDAFLLGACCPGDIEQSSQEVAGCCCVQGAI